MAPASSTTCAAIPSHSARTTWAGVVSRPSPDTDARTSPRHEGAARPAKAGTNVTPPESGTLPPSRSRSSAPPITPRSVSQRTAEATV